MHNLETPVYHPVIPRRRRQKSRDPKETLPRIGEGMFPLLDPLTVKELKGLSRHWQNHVGRVLHVGLIACVLLRWWSNVTTHPSQYTNSDFAVFGRSLFVIFMPGQFLLVLLAAISMGSDMITKEVRTGTLGLLDMASVSAGQIAVSKWKAVMVSAASLVMCGLPVLAICSYLGGVRPWEIVWSSLLTLAMAGIGAAHSIRYSARVHSPLTAILKTVGLIFGLAVPLAILAACGDFTMALAGVFSPIYAAIAAGQGPPTDFRIFAVTGSLLYALFRTLRILQKAGGHVRTRVQSPLAAPRPLTDPELFEANYRRLTLHGPRTLMIRRRIWDRWELLWKEWTTRPATRLPRDARIAIGVVITFLTWVLWECSYRGWTSGSFFFLGSIFLVLATIDGAMLFGNEKDGMKIDMLLSTPLTTRQIVGTKLVSGLVVPESLVAHGLLLLTVWGWFRAGGPAALAAAATVTVVFVLFAYALGAAASLFTKTVRGAVLISVGLIAGVVVGLPWIAETALPLGRGEWLGRVAACFNVFPLLDGLHRSPEQVTLPPMAFREAFQQALPLAAGYAGLSLLLIASIFYRFRGITGRSRG